MFARTLIASCLLWALLTPGLADDSDYSEKLSDAEKGLLTAINKERRTAGVAELKVNGKLMAAARIHARNMAAADTGKHELKDLRPEWRTADDRIKHVGFRGFAWGENIAWSYARPEQVTGGWMTSEGHKRNMLHADFEEVGIAVSRGASGAYWCAVFGRSSPPPIRSDTAGSGNGGSPSGESRRERGQPNAAPRDAAPRDAKSGSPASASGEAWRYRWHRGRWWYWLPSKQWVVWVDGQWVKAQ